LHRYYKEKIPLFKDLVENQMEKNKNLLPDSLKQILSEKLLELGEGGTGQKKSKNINDIMQIYESGNEFEYLSETRDNIIDYYKRKKRIDSKYNINKSKITLMMNEEKNIEMVKKH